MDHPSAAHIGIALFLGGGVAVAVTWAWSRFAKRIPRMPKIGKRVVSIGRTQTSMADGHAKEEAVETASRILGERWALERVIGRGGMGRVWEGGDRRTGRRIAVKTMEAADQESRKVLRDIYLSEARALSHLRHPNVVDFIEVVPDGDAVALVFAFVSGKTLQQMIAEEQRLGWEPLRAIFVPVARALAAAHAAGVVHRDMKPANIMIADDGIVKVMDFGVARLLAPDPHAPTAGPARRKSDDAMPSTRTSTLVGTPAYMPPEALRGLVTPRGDLFSTGVCLHEALTGRLPFGFDGWTVDNAALRRPASSLAPGVFRAVDALLDELLEPDPERRLPDAQSLERRLLDI